VSNYRNPASLILVEDNQRLREELENALEGYGYDLRGVDGAEALDVALQQRRADVLVLDLNLGGEDGISIAKRMRITFPNIGIVILTARVQSCEKQEGYQSGADVYMTKPARPAELSAAINNLYKRLAPQPLDDAWVLDTTGLRMIFQHTTMIPLTSSECALLRVLAVKNECVDIGMLQENMRENDLSATKFKLRLEVLISRLRQKLMPYTASVNPIQSVRGRGYMMCLPVKLQ
jgi:DNA-binding response OmpR family regulator